LLVVAEGIREVTLPEDSMVVCREAVAGLKNLRVHENVQNNFAVGTDRALIFSSQIQPGVFAIWTTNTKIIKRLTAEFNKLWYGAGGAQ
jgi:hypothetical protein